MARICKQGFANKDLRVASNRESEYQVNYGQHHDQEDDRHGAPDPHKIGYPVTAGTNDQRIDLVSGQDE